jgi:hypothetical protein
MGYRVRTRSAARVYPAVTSRAGQVERSRAAPASAAGVRRSHGFIRLPQRERSAPICVSSNSRPPTNSPPPLFTHLLQILVTCFGALCELAGLPTCLFFSGRLALRDGAPGRCLQIVQTIDRRRFAKIDFFFNRRFAFIRSDPILQGGGWA